MELVNWQLTSELTSSPWYEVLNILTDKLSTAIPNQVRSENLKTLIPSNDGTNSVFLYFIDLKPMLPLSSPIQQVNTEIDNAFKLNPMAKPFKTNCILTLSMKNSKTKQSYLTYICIVFSSLLARLLLYFVVRNDASMFNKSVHGINSIIDKTDSFVLNPSAMAFRHNLNENLGHDAIHFSRENLVVCNNNREGSNTSENLDRTFLLQKYIFREFVDKSDINHKEVSQV